MAISVNVPVFTVSAVVRVAFVTAPAVRLAAVPDTFVITPDAGVPSAGVTNVGEAPKLVSEELVTPELSVAPDSVPAAAVTVMFALPLKLTPFMSLALTSTVAVSAFPVKAPTNAVEVIEVAPAMTPASRVTVPSNVIACPVVGLIASVVADALLIVFPLIVMSSTVRDTKPVIAPKVETSQFVELIATVAVPSPMVATPSTVRVPSVLRLAPMVVTANAACTVQNTKIVLRAMM